MLQHDVRNYYNYLYTKQLNLNIPVIFNSCRHMHGFIEQNKDVLITSSNAIPAGESAPTSTKLYSAYNLFLYPLPGFYELFNEIKTAFYQFSDDTDNYYIRSWLNVFNDDKQLDWHTHFHNELTAWHGFFCVHTEPASYTEYKLPLVQNVVTIDSRDNLLVIGRSRGDFHRPSKWVNADVPRITIAFDIISEREIPGAFTHLNHWIPL